MFSLEAASTHAALDVCALFGRSHVTITVRDQRMRVRAGSDDCTASICLVGAGDTDIDVTVDGRLLRGWVTGDCVTGVVDGALLRRADGRTLRVAPGGGPPAVPPLTGACRVHPQELASAIATVLCAAPARRSGRVWIGGGGVLMAAGPVIAWAPCPDAQATFSCALAGARALERLSAAEGRPLQFGEGQIHGGRWAIWQHAPAPVAPTWSLPHGTWNGTLHSRAFSALGPERLPQRTLTFAGDVATLCGEVLCARGDGHAVLRVDVDAVTRLACALGPGMIDMSACADALHLRAGRAWALYRP